MALSACVKSSSVAFRSVLYDDGQICVQKPRSGKNACSTQQLIWGKEEAVLKKKKNVFLTCMSLCFCFVYHQKVHT